MHPVAKIIACRTGKAHRYFEPEDRSDGRRLDPKHGDRGGGFSIGDTIKFHGARRYGERRAVTHRLRTMTHLDALNSRMIANREALRRKGWYHSIRLPGGRVTDGLLSLESLEQRLAAMPIPANLAGKRVLDVGAWDGWLSFEMERRGATVVAIDCTELETFRSARKALKSAVEFRRMNVLELSESSVGKFDIVLFLGVLYHVKHPLLALERVCSVTDDLAIVESFVTDSLGDRGPSGSAVLEFYETTELAGQLDNWWGPNIAALEALVRTAGFIRVSEVSRTGDRACLASYRKWPELPAELTSKPVLHSAFNARFGGINCHTSEDDYVECWFQAADQALNRNSVYAEVGSYGVQPAYITEREGLWVANFHVPPGLPVGWHPVRVRTVESAWSNSLRIAIDLECSAASLHIKSICDARTWAPDSASQGGHVSLWIAGLPDNADVVNVHVDIGDWTHLPEYVSNHCDDRGRQVNVELRDGIGPGVYNVCAQFGSTRSSPVRLTVT